MRTCAKGASLFGLLGAGKARSQPPSACRLHYGSEMTNADMSRRLLTIQELEHLATAAQFHPVTMADLWPISMRQMERIFVKEFGKTPHEWIKEFRCRLARELIAKGWSNKAVVIELNFGNEAQLCHDFHKVYACPPQSFAPLYGTGASQELPISEHRVRLPQ
jgi:transcriptional regulator GlxA family with amidase domain